MSDILRDIHEELRVQPNSPYDVEFSDLPQIDIDDRLVMLNSHPYNPLNKKKGYRNIDTTIYDEDWDWLEIDKTILNDLQIIRKLQVVKVVKKMSNNIFCITISPNPDIHQDTSYLHGLLSQVVRGCKVVKYYGVFERGSKNDIYHTHFLIEYINDKNIIQNLKKNLKKKNDKAENIIFKIEKVGGPTHLLKCLRYFEKDTKKNFGYFENRDGRNDFYQLTNFDPPILRLKPEIKI